MTADNQAQIIDDKIKHDAIREDAWVAGEDLALTGIFNITFQRKHPHLPRFRHQPIKQSQQIHIHCFGVFGATKQQRQRLQRAFNRFAIIADDKRPNPCTGNNHQFSGLIECSKASTGHQITAENCTENNQVT